MTKIREVILPQNWIKGRYAIDDQDISVSCLSPDVAKLCLVGWIDRIYSATDQYFDVLEKVKEEVKTSNPELTSSFHIVENFNDSFLTTFKDIKALVDKLDI